MRFSGKIKYLVVAAAIVFILFWIIAHQIYRRSYSESEYFINYFPFTHRTSALESLRPPLNKLKIEKVDIVGNRAEAIRLPLQCSIDYYLKIPKDARLKIFLKHYGPKKLRTPEEVIISIQEEHKPIESLHSIKYPKGIIENQWETEQVSLNQYGDKIARLSFSAIRYGGAAKHSEGFLFRPLLMIREHLLQSQSKKTHPVRLEIKPEKLRQINVVMIMLDAARPDHFSCYGYHRQTTPYIDQFAQESVIFKNAFSVAPYTLASTTSLFTSLYPNTHQVVRWEQKIPQELKMLPEVFAQHGYSTYGSGFVLKWARKGFKETFELHFSTEKNFKGDLNRFLLKTFTSKKHSIPSFIYMHLDPPHSDYNPLEKFDKWSDKKIGAKQAELVKSSTLYRISRGEISISQEELQFIIDKYDGNLLWADWLVHLIVEGFKKSGLYDNSLIIVASDHGEAFYEHSKMMHNSTVYNEMIKIPLIIKFPSYIKPKKKIIKAYVENIDLMPTLLEFFQINYSHFNMQGKSLLPLILGDSNQVKSYLFARAVNDRVFSLIDSRYKYVHMRNRGELYNIRSDPYEKADLASSKPILFGYYQSLAHFYRQEIKRAQIIKPAEAKLDEETIMKLRSLGYLQR